MSERQRLKADRPADGRADLRSFLDIGRITAPHGIAGEVRVFPMTDDNDRFNELKECFLTAPDESSRKTINILSARPNPPFMLLRLEGVNDRTAAEKLKGWLLTVDRAHAVALPEGSHFICDLIGCEVTDTRFGYLGKLSDILQNLAHDVYVLSLPGQADVLFPALKQIIHQVDVEARTMEVTLPDGLYEVYRTVSAAPEETSGEKEPPSAGSSGKYGSQRSGRTDR